MFQFFENAISTSYTANTVENNGYVHQMNLLKDLSIQRSILNITYNFLVILLGYFPLFRNRLAVIFKNLFFHTYTPVSNIILWIPLFCEVP